jgi:hypothetical protein
MYKIYSVGFNVQVTLGTNDTKVSFPRRLDLTMRGRVYGAWYSAVSAACTLESETWSHDPR